MEKKVMNINPKKVGIIIAAVVGIVILALASSSIFENVSAGEIHV